MARSIIEELGFERAIDINKSRNISVSQKEIINQVNKFEIDKVYFSQDEKNSYPAVFIKKVKSFDESTLKDIAKIHKKAWNYKKVSFLYVYDDVEIRIYNCMETPVFITNQTNYKKELEKKELKSYKYSDKEQLEELLHIFSSIAIDSGLIWSIEEAVNIREKIKIQQRVDKYLVESLTETTKKLMDEGLKIEIIHRLILRSLFLLYLEGRGATDEIFYAKIKKEAKNYFDILKDKNATYLLYEKLEIHFNGNVFSIETNEDKNIKEKHLAIIRKCFISGYNKNTLQMELFPDWRLFDFGISSIELISQIYENFLSKVDPNQKKKSGTYYTPPSLVELILNEKLSINSNEKQYELNSLEKMNFADMNFTEEPSLFNKKSSQFKSYWEKKISKLYNISLNDLICISDTVSFSIDLFFNQEKSKALYPVLLEQTTEYAKKISNELNDFIGHQDLFINATIYKSNQFTPLMMIKLSHEKIKKDITISNEEIDEELEKINKYLWEEKATNIYFRKKLNYEKGDDIYIIRPNQRRFWSQSMALEDASELILELLNGVHDAT